MRRSDNPASSLPSRSGLRPSSPLFDAWVDEARSADILAEATARGAKLRRSGAEWIGPCPACGGTDRFSVNTAKRIFNCRGAGKGGDVIALVEYLDASDFIAACTTLTGREPPTGEQGKVDQETVERRRRDRERQEADRALGEIDYRESERRRAWAIWHAGLPLSASRSELRSSSPLVEPDPVAGYLAGRALGLVLARKLPLRYAPALEYWHKAEGWRKPQVVYCGPAMLAAIVDDQEARRSEAAPGKATSGRFAGVHMTWVDPDQPGAKATIIDPATGELLPAKKVRGSKRRAAIKLWNPPDATRLVTGEGIETTLSVMNAEMQEAGSAEGATGKQTTAYWAAIDLGHLGGRADGTVAHPTWIVTDKRGRRRLKQVPGPVPLLDPDRDLMPDDRFSEIVILGDGDSDRFVTETTVQRAAARWARPGRTISAAWPGDGVDFNDVLMAQATKEVA